MQKGLDSTTAHRGQIAGLLLLRIKQGVILSCVNIADGQGLEIWPAY